MKTAYASIFLLFVALLMVAGCSKTEKAAESQKLYELYPGRLEKVDLIEMVNGATGERKSFEDTAYIQDWIKKVRNLNFDLDPNQEMRDGYLYSVSFYENKLKIFGLTPNSVSNGHYYLYNEELESRMQELFETKQ